MTVPKRFEPVRMQCAHYPDFCPRNAIEGSDRCELHQQRVVAVEAPPLWKPPADLPVVPPVASPAADYDDDNYDGLLVDPTWVDDGEDQWG